MAPGLVHPGWFLPPYRRTALPPVFEPRTVKASNLRGGGWGWAGGQWRGGGDAEGRAALREAVEQGITFFDTALAYGAGHSERLIGEVLKEEIRSGRAIVATKIPPRNQ